MRKFAKFILIAAGLALLVYTLAVLGLNIYLQSAGLQNRIRTAAESAAGSPIGIKGTCYTPWSGFSITGVTMQGKALQGQPPFLNATSMSFRFSLLALLQGKLVVSEVLVSDPFIVSLAPQPTPTPEPENPKPVRPEPSATPVVILVNEPPAGVEIVVPEEAPPPSLTQTPVQVEKVRIANGKAQFFDSKGALAITLTGMDVTGELMPDRSVAGTFRIAETTVGAYMRPKHVVGTFTWKNGLLVIPDLRAEWAGGQIAGSIEIGPDKSVSVIAAAEGILLKKLATDAGISGDGSRGSLFSKGSVQGISGKPETFTGRVDVSLQQARFLPLEPIRQIGEFMGIQELQMFELKTAEAVFNIRDKKVNADTLVLESENLVMDAKGPIGFDGKMKLQARLHLNEKLRKDLGGLLGENFKESDRPGYKQMPFSITGTISRPKSDLLDKLTGFRIGEDVGGLIKNLFRLPQKPKSQSPKEPGGG